MADFGEDSFKGFNVGDGLIDAGKEIREESLLELPAFGVVPMVFGLLPFGAQIVGETSQPILTSAHVG